MQTPPASGPALPNPWISGLRMRCPQCGNGSLFQGLLTLRPGCSHCQADFANADTGDGPAVFVILIVGAIVLPLAVATGLRFAPPIWLQLVLWPIVATALALALLPRFKATMFALQWVHRASEARRQDLADPQGR